jgi:mRNA guanylyltransferase
MPSYYVCEKSDGQRYLLFCTSDPETGAEAHFLIDRRNDYWFTPGLHFPIKDDPKFQSFHLNTLIDGELVLDRLPNGSVRAKYLVFDCLILDRKSLMTRTLDKRLAYFKDWMFEPYQELLRRFPEEVQYMPFVVELKPMQFPYAMEMMFRQVLPSLPHGNDGLIFTCRSTDYKHGTDPHILKWKPENENSVDFRTALEFERVQPDARDRAEGVTEPWIDYDAVPTVNLMVWAGDREGDRWYGTMHLEPEEWEGLKALGEPLDERVVECYMDERKRWRYMRFRDDKDKANHISTVESVIESIRDRVTEKELIGSAKRIRDEWKRRAGQPPGPPAGVNGVKS